MTDNIVKIADFVDINQHINPNKSENKGENIMDNHSHVTREELDQLKENIDLKITNAVQPLEAKIDNLPDKFRLLLHEERDFQKEQRKQTNQFIWGTIVIGLISIGVSIGGIIL